MQEKTIVNKIAKYLKTLDGCFFWKEHGGAYGNAGIPDLICCIDGRFVGLEVKTDKGRVSKLQEVTIGKIQQAGGLAAVVRSVDDVRDVLKEVRA